MDRSVIQVIKARHQTEGGGFKVRRPLPSAGLRYLDPILLIDEMGPVDYQPGEAVGAPDHPHRGFETVTYMLDGEFEHRDSAGHAGRLQPGDVQWMTAGRGVVHSEMPATRIMQQGGRVHGFQIWVNLPARLKMTQPRYQEVAASSIPEAVSDDGLARVRVIAGEALGVSARIDTHTPIVYQHWILQPGAQVSQSLPSDCNAMLYVFSGAIESSGKALLDGELGILGKGDSVDLSVPATAKDTAQLLLLGGEALAEPVVQHGPFVMNTREEINQAITDYQQGHMGIIQQARQ
jgi:redox-sensitive bicupin YhaK (pirin superfamily)